MPRADLIFAAEMSLGDAVALALTGMAIVFVALGLITLFLFLLPHIMEKLNAVFPESDHHHGHAPAAAAPKANDDEELIAAIGFALHSRRSENG